MIKDLKKMKRGVTQVYLAIDNLGKGKSKCKGPEAEVGLPCSKLSKEAGMAEVE